MLFQIIAFSAENVKNGISRKPIPKQGRFVYDASPPRGEFRILCIGDDFAALPCFVPDGLRNTTVIQISRPGHVDLTNGNSKLFGMSLISA
jgi:hypothetical protein